MHWTRNLLAYAAPKQRAAVAAMIRTIFAQETKAEAFAQWDKVADMLRDRDDRLGALMDAAREDVLTYMDYPKEQCDQLAGTNPLERLNKEIKRRRRRHLPKRGRHHPPGRRSLCWNSPTNGWSAAATSAWEASPGTMILIPSSCPPPRQPDQPRTRPGTWFLHQISGRDP